MLKREQLVLLFEEIRYLASLATGFLGWFEGLLGDGQ